MAIRSGIAAQLGFAAETTWGTFATPTRFLEVNSFAIKNDVQRIESAAIRANNRVLRQDRFASNPKGTSGSIELEVVSKGFGLIFKHMLGAVAITTPSGATNSRLHTHTLGDLYGLGLTIQGGIPDVAGTVQPFSWLGNKVSEWTLSNELDGILMLGLNTDGSSEVTNQSLASASYAASTELLTYAGGTITLAGSAFDVSAFSLSGNNGLKTDRYFIRGSTTKKEPIPAALVELTGSLTAEFEGLTAYNRFVNGTVASLSATWLGSTIESTFKYSVTVTLPAVRFDGETPEVGGPDVVGLSLPFKVLFDGSQEPITIAYQTTDTAS